MKSLRKKNQKAKKLAEKKRQRKYISLNQKIWESFLRTEEKEFREAFKFGKEEIEKIGIEKFVKAMGFKNADDVGAWKNYAMHLVICPDCGRDFGIYEFYSICKSCEKNYDMEKVHKMHTQVVKENNGEANPGEFLYAFYSTKSLRNFCLNSRSKDKNKACVLYALVFDEEKQDFHVRLLEDLKSGEKAKFVLESGELYEESGAQVFEITKDASTTEDGFCEFEYEPFTKPLPINAFAKEV